MDNALNSYFIELIHHHLRKKYLVEKYTVGKDANGSYIEFASGGLFSKKTRVYFDYSYNEKRDGSVTLTVFEGGKNEGSSHVGFDIDPSFVCTVYPDSPHNLCNYCGTENLTGVRSCAECGGPLLKT